MRFYALMDSVRLAGVGDDADHRRLRASGRLMLDLLLSDEAPVLAQNQVFDSRLLLDVVAAGDEDSDAVVRLFRRGHLRARLMIPPGQVEQPPTLLGAFRTAVADNSLLVAWPELEDDDAREQVEAVLAGRSEADLGEDLGPRVEAVRELDQALRRSDDDELASVDPGTPFARLVTDELDRVDQPAHVARLWADLRRRTLPRSDDLDLERRTGWYRVLERHREEAGLGPDHGALRTLRSSVDLQYNRRVAWSFGATDVVDETVWDDADDLLVPPGTAVGPVSSRIHDESRTDWLTWADLPLLREELMDLSARRRLTLLQRRRAVALAEDGSLSVSVRRVPARFAAALPGEIAGTVTSAGAATLVAGLLSEMVVGTLATAVGKVAVTTAAEVVRTRRAGARSMVVPVGGGGRGRA